jgi:hypothetical protein
MLRTASQRGSRLILSAALGALVAVCAAQDSQPTSAPTPHTWLRVTADMVHLRTRPDANSIPAVQVAAGTVLEAVERDPYDWYRVLPPPGVFSFVAAEFIERRSPTEGVVAVRSGTLRVRVGSAVQNVDPEQSEVQTRLERGAKVEIIGEQDGWLRIAPPPGVFVYVGGQYVVPLSADEAARQRANAAAAPTPIVAAAPAPACAPASGPTSQPAYVAPAPPLPLATQPTASSAPATPETRPATPTSPTPAPLASAPATKPAEGLDLAGTWGQRLRAIENDIEAETRKPALERNWAPLMARLKGVAVQREEPTVARLASAWLRQLDEREAEQATLREAEAALERGERATQQHEREMSRIQKAQQAASQPEFAGRGELLRSFAVDARGPARRICKLQNPLTGQVDAYVQVAAGTTLDLNAFLGQYVGVRGARQADKTLGADLIYATEIIPLQTTTAPASQPASGPARQAP